MAKFNWELLDSLTRTHLKHRPGPIVEIGIGESTPILLKAAIEHDVVLYSCDIKKFNLPLSHAHEVFTCSSFTFMDEVIDKKGIHPSIVFLDGCHNYPIVKTEVDFFLPRLVEDGIILMHDTLPPDESYLGQSRCSDCYKVRHELENNDYVNCFTFPYTAYNVGLTIVMKKPKCVV